MYIVWGANSYIVTPDAIPAWTSLQLGPIYSVRAGDTLEDIAVRYYSIRVLLVNAPPPLYFLPPLFIYFPPLF